MEVKDDLIENVEKEHWIFDKVSEEVDAFLRGLWEKEKI
jgi:hypothetical protein